MNLELRAFIYKTLGELVKALADVDRAMMIEQSDLASLVITKCRILMDMNKNEAALSTFESVLNKLPSQFHKLPLLLFTRATILAANKDFDGAERDMKDSGTWQIQGGSINLFF